MMRWRRLILGDWRLKLLGFAIAGVLWVYVRSEQMLHLTLDIPLELHNPPGTLRLVRPPPRTVEVRLEAHRDVIPLLKPKTVRAVVDLAGVTDLKISIALSAAHIRRPAGVVVLDISPSQLRLEFARAPAGKRAGARTRH